MLQSVDSIEERARVILLGLLEKGPKSSDQLKKALERRDIPEPIIDDLLKRFSEVQLIDDQSYAQDIAQASRTAKGLGKAMVSKKLADKGLDQNIIDGVLESISEQSELETATQLANKRAKQLRDLDTETRTRRLLGYLQRRGFSSQVAFSAIRASEIEAVKSEV